MECVSVLSRHMVEYVKTKYHITDSDTLVRVVCHADVAMRHLNGAQLFSFYEDDADRLTDDGDDGVKAHISVLHEHFDALESRDTCGSLILDEFLDQVWRAMPDLTEYIDEREFLLRFQRELVVQDAVGHVKGKRRLAKLKRVLGAELEPYYSSSSD